MHYLKLTIQRNRRADPARAAAALAAADRPDRCCLFFYPGPAALEPDRAGNLAGQLAAGPARWCLIDDSLSMGYTAGDATALPAGPRTAAAAAGELDPAPGPLHDRDHLGPAGARCSTKSRGRAATSCRRPPPALPLSATHTAWPAVLEGLDEVLALVYLSHEAAHHPDRPAQGRLGPRRRAQSAGDGTSRGCGCGSSTSATTRPQTSRSESLVAARSHGPGRRAQPLGGRDPQRLAARDLRRQGHPPSSTTSRPRSCCRRSPPTSWHGFRWPCSSPGPGRMNSRCKLPEDELPGDNQCWAAVPVKDSLLIRLVDGEPSTEPFGSEVDYLAAPLSIGIGAAEAWRVEAVQEEDFLSPRMDPPDVLVLANVASPTPDEAERLNQMVECRHGPLDLHRRQARHRPVQRPAVTGRPISGSCRLRSKHWSTRTFTGCCRAAASVADRETPGLEGFGARAGGGAPVHVRGRALR